MTVLARKVFTGGDYLWKTYDPVTCFTVELDVTPVVHRRFIHRANVRSPRACGRWWITSGQNIVQKSVSNEYRPQSTALLPPITESDPDLQRDVER